MTQHSPVLEEDRRGSQRWRYTLRMTMSWGSQQITVYTSDISMSGVFLETNRCLPVGTEVGLDFELVSGGNPTPVHVEGTVARRVFAQRKDDQKHLVGVGVEFRKFHEGEALLQEVLTGLQHPAPHKNEQRTAARIPVSIPLTWGTSDACDQSGHLFDISVDGAFVIHAARTRAPGTRLYLRFEVPHQGRFREVKAVATVVRSVASEAAPADGMAVIFELSTVDVDYLHSFINRRLPSDQTPGRARSDRSRGQDEGRLSRLTRRAGTSITSSRGFSGGGQVRLKWIFKALCYTLPVMLVLLLLLLS